MKKKKFFITLGILILLSSSIFGYFALLNDPLDIITTEEEILREDVEEYNLLEEDNFVLGCLIGYEENALWCYSKEFYDFQRVSVLEEYVEFGNLSNGLVLLELKGKNLSEYPVDLDALLDKWYEEIADNQENLFFTEVENGVHVDLYNLVQWRFVQESASEITLEEIKSELESLKDDKYAIMSPIRYVGLQRLYEQDTEDFEYWYSTRNKPSALIDQTNSTETWDFGDLKLNYPRLRYLTIGLNTLNSEESVNSHLIRSYEKYENNFSNYHGIENREVITFMADYLSIGLLGYWENLYEGWTNGQREHYYKFLDVYKADRDYLLIKLNVLNEEYEL